MKNIIPKGFDFTSEEWENSFKNNTPLVVVPFISTKCNIDCIYCMMNDERKAYSGSGLTLEEHKKVLLDAYELGCRTMVITGLGEPFMDPNFYDPKTKEFPLIDIAEEIGFYTIVFTNGTFINEEIAERLFSKKVSLILKLSSLNKEIFSCLNNVPLRFEDYMCKDGINRSIPYYLKNLFEAGFAKTLENNTTRLIADVIITQMNIEEIPDIIDFCLKNNMLVCLDPLVVKSNAYDNIDKLGITEDQNRNLYNKIKNMFKEYDMDMYDLSKCIIHHNGIVYDLDGNIRRCLSVASNVGNVKTESLRELWQKISKEKLEATKESDNYQFEDIFGKCPGRCFFNFRNHN